jgi:hypothetical protein
MDFVNAIIDTDNYGVSVIAGLFEHSQDEKKLLALIKEILNSWLVVYEYSEDELDEWANSLLNEKETKVCNGSKLYVQWCLGIHKIEE